MSGLSVLDSARELTALAWRRTLLRWVVIAVVGARFFLESAGAIAIAVALLAVVVGGALSLAAAREYSQVRTGSGLPTPWVPDALRIPAVRLGVLLVGTLGLGVAALVWVIAG